MSDEINAVKAKYLGIALTVGLTVGVVIGSMTGITDKMALSICLGANFGMLASILIPALLKDRQTKLSEQNKPAR